MGSDTWKLIFHRVGGFHPLPWEPRKKYAVGNRVKVALFTAIGNDGLRRHREQKLKVIFITFRMIETNTDINSSLYFRSFVKLNEMTPPYQIQLITSYFKILSFLNSYINIISYLFVYGLLKYLVIIF